VSFTEENKSPTKEKKKKRASFSATQALKEVKVA
jgi:hypothetical protein